MFGTPYLFGAIKRAFLCLVICDNCYPFTHVFGITHGNLDVLYTPILIFKDELHGLLKALLSPNPSPKEREFDLAYPWQVPSDHRGTFATNKKTYLDNKIFEISAIP